MKTLEQALSLAAIAKVENERRNWLRLYRNAPEGQVALSMAHFDEQRSKALTQDLADAICSRYPEIV